MLVEGKSGVSSVFGTSNFVDALIDVIYDRQQKLHSKVGTLPI